MLVHAVPGTAHALRWRPLVAVSGVLLAAALLSRTSDRPAGALLAVTSAALASAVVAGLHDPASRLVAATPLSRALRRLVRVALVTAPVLGLWSLIVSVVGAPDHLRSPAPLLALAASGVAAAAWAPERYGVLLGSMVPVLWFALGSCRPGTAWSRTSPCGGATDPWPVLAVALLAAAPTWRMR